MMPEDVELESVATELMVHIKGGDSSYKHLFLLYDVYEISPDDETIKHCVDEARKEFKGEIESITIKIVMQL